MVCLGEVERGWGGGTSETRKLAQSGFDIWPSNNICRHLSPFSGKFSFSALGELFSVGNATRLKSKVDMSEHRSLVMRILWDLFWLDSYISSSL